jgi:hypothetical protein
MYIPLVRGLFKTAQHRPLQIVQAKYYEPQAFGTSAASEYSNL